MRARRSILSVPATERRFHAKAAESAADMVILDLEDSVAPARKEDARGLVLEALRGHSYEGKLRAVRINGLDTAWWQDDLGQVVPELGDRLDVVVVPKVESAGAVEAVAGALDELGSSAGLDLQIESARGMEAVSEIAAASRRVQALHFGPGDFGADLRMPGLSIGAAVEDYPGDIWHPFLARILVAARANGLLAVDGPYANVRDLDGLRRSARRSALLGYDGKWALNPAQADVLNEVYAPAQEEFDKASAILSAYERSTEAGQGAARLGAEMIDEATRKMALVTVERGRAAGMTAGTWEPEID